MQRVLNRLNKFISRQVWVCIVTKGSESLRGVRANELDKKITAIMEQAMRSV